MRLRRRRTTRHRFRYGMLGIVLVTLTACMQDAVRPQTAAPTAAIVAPSPGPSAVFVPSPVRPTPAIPLPATATIVDTPPITPFAATPAPPSPAPPSEAGAREEQLVAAVNALRAQQGFPPYTVEPALGEVARLHSCDLAARGVISHTSSDGRTLQERLGALAGQWSWPSESIAVGTDDPAEVVALWLDEPPDGWHRRNMLDPDQRVVGAGYCAAPQDPSGNRFYWTMVVAR